MKKTIVVIDDNDFFLRRANLKIKTYLTQNNMEDKIEVVLVDKDEIYKYRDITHIDIALVDYSFLLQSGHIDGLQICKEIFEKHPQAKVAIISSLPDVEKIIDDYNQESKNFIHQPKRSFDEIVAFIDESLKNE